MKKKKAVALSYDQSGAPKVVAKGEGEIASQIIRRANEEGIPIHNNSSLVEALMKIQLSNEIPPQLYKAVAEILALIYALDRHAGNKAVKTQD